MSRVIYTEPLTATAFAPYGQVIETGSNPRIINAGLCERHHDLCTLDAASGKIGISVFSAQARALPYAFALLERHPEGSQAFIPMTQEPFLVIVSDSPEHQPRAFLTNGRQGINLARGTWHGVLTPLAEPGLFTVVDRIGEGANLEEVTLEQPWLVERAL